MFTTLRLRATSILAVAALALFAAGALTGCGVFSPYDPTREVVVDGYTVTANPLAEAETIGQHYAAITGAYNAVLETLGDYIDDGRVPASRAVTVARVEAEATPIFDALDEAYEAARNAEAQVAGFDEATTEAEFYAALEYALEAYLSLYSIFEEAK